MLSVLIQWPHILKPMYLWLERTMDGKEFFNFATQIFCAQFGCPSKNTLMFEGENIARKDIVAWQKQALKVKFISGCWMCQWQGIRIALIMSAYSCLFAMSKVSANMTHNESRICVLFSWLWKTRTTITPTLIKISKPKFSQRWDCYAKLAQHKQDNKSDIGFWLWCMWHYYHFHAWECMYESATLT